MLCENFADINKERVQAELTVSARIESLRLTVFSLLILGKNRVLVEVVGRIGPPMKRVLQLGFHWTSSFNKELKEVSFPCFES